jgi:hypothetical protein
LGYCQLFAVIADIKLSSLTAIKSYYSFSKKASTFFDFLKKISKKFLLY